MRSVRSFDEHRDDRDADIAEARQVARLRKELDQIARDDKRLGTNCVRWFAIGAYHLHVMSVTLGEARAWTIFRQEAEKRGLL